MIVDKITGQPASAYTPPEDIIVVSQPTSGACQFCGEVIRRIGPAWVDNAGLDQCGGMFFTVHEPHRVDWQ